MKRRELILIAAILVTLAACGAKPAARQLQGYAEAEYLYLSPRDPGYVDALAVKEGDEVAAGAAIFTMDTARAAAALDKARAAEAASGGAASAAGQGIAEARANAELARASLARTRALYAQDFASKAMLDSAQSAYDAAFAATRAAEAQTGAAGRQTEAAGADVALARTQMRDRAVRAPQAGRVERVFRRPGEFANAGEPVIALLPPQNIKLRFFAPEPLLAKLQLGAIVRVTCDGCAGPIDARISFIASEPQFTPPVIYSLDQREKLVFLVEARPLRMDQAKPLRPGQPVDVGLVS
jgi:HlyD family secretion protein